MSVAEIELELISQIEILSWLMYCYLTYCKEWSLSKSGPWMRKFNVFYLSCFCRRQKTLKYHFFSITSSPW